MKVVLPNYPMTVKKFFDETCTLSISTKILNKKFNVILDINNDAFLILSKLPCNYLDIPEINQEKTKKFINQLVDKKILSIEEDGVRRNVVRSVTEEDSLNILELELTTKCPLRCKHCYVNAGHQGDTMDLDTYEKTLVLANASGVDYIQLTGGEPLLHPKIGRFITLLDNSNNTFNLSITTSGYKINGAVKEKLAEYNKTNHLFIQVSVDGEEETHNLIRGKNDAFKETVEFIEWLIKTKIKMAVALCLINQSEREIKDLLLYLKGIGVPEVRISMVTEQGRQNEKPAWNKTKIYELAKYIQETKLSTEHFIVNIENQEESQLHTIPKNCGAGYKIIKVNSKGDIFPCVMHEYKLGNIKDMDACGKIKSIISYKRKFANMIAPCRTKCSDCSKVDECFGCHSKQFQNYKLRRCPLNEW